MYSVIMIHRPVFTLFYIFIMLFKLCHLSLISHSTISFSISSDQLEGDNTLQKFSKSFNHASFSNFSLFTIIIQKGKASLFAVCKNDTIIHLDIESMDIVNIYRKNGCPYTSKYECEESVTINFLSEIKLLNHRMIWFCYILPYNNYPSPTASNCMVPKNNILPEDLKWTKSGFSSTSNSYRTFAVQTQHNIFMASYASNSLVILRTNLPNVLGQIDSSQDLTTPIADFYFEKHSHFLEAFKTKYEVYFVASEPITGKSNNIPECIASSDTRKVMSTRIIRICKDDPGGVLHYNEKNFGTIAKAEVICPVGIGSTQYHYTRSISASWSGDKLYILFESQKNSPAEKVLCVYDEFAFNFAFNSEMKLPIFFQNLDKSQKIENPIVDICKKLTENKIKENEKIEANSMSSNGLYRSKNIIPIGEAPLMTLRSLKYKFLTTFKLSTFDPSTIIILISDNSIRMVSHTNDFKICFIQDYHVNKHEIINQVKGDKRKFRAFIYISTNTRVIQLELKMCPEYTTKSLCLTKAPNICGWDSRHRTCRMLIEDIDFSRWERSACKDLKVDNEWSSPMKCNITKSEKTQECTCKYCLLENGCSNGKRVHVTNCSGIYSEWSTWNECSVISHYQQRTRICVSHKCMGPFIQYKKCEYSSSDTVSSWTKWYKSYNSQYLVSFRTKCSVNAPPIIERREIFCDKSCLDKTFKWSSWSECTDLNIQYRLLNCSALDGCPYLRTQIKQCQPIPRKFQQDTEGKENGYSVIHIVMATMVVSIIWLLILFVVIICNLYPSNLRPTLFKIFMKKKTIPLPPLPSIQFQPIFNRTLYSETSNDYLSTDMQFSLNTHNDTDVSFTDSIESDRIHPYSRKMFGEIPLISENHPNIHDT